MFVVDLVKVRSWYVLLAIILLLLLSILRVIKKVLLVWMHKIKSQSQGLP